MRSGIAIAAVCAWALFVAGCGQPPCNAVCARHNACPGATPQECDGYCTNNENITERMGCADLQHALMQCEADTPEFCTDGGTARGCPDQTTAFVACVHAFCATHAGDRACALVP